ncbi:MAG: A/G-specific adenine glycosylase [Bacteroidota bacterium]
MNFGGIIRLWYKKNLRDLPMRRTRDPYKIWIAEVIMQQTRINQGLPYYHAFLDAFPDVASLAAAGEDEVLKKWQGLGYYNRARNLQEAARDIEKRFGGHMPSDYEGLLSLKGVGKYTAAAIASFCYGEAVPAVDGNVARVISRLFGVEEAVNSSAGEKQIYALAQALMDETLGEKTNSTTDSQLPTDPRLGSTPAGIFNQAMIEFGAMWCVPVSPDCGGCPLKEHCEAYGRGRVDQLPAKVPKKKPVDRWICFYIVIYKGEIILTRRGTDDIWKSLYQFPLSEWDVPPAESEMLELWPSLFAPALPPAFSLKGISPEIKHQLSHQTLHARFIHLELLEWPRELPEGWMKISMDRVDDYPVPRLINRYMESSNFFYL